MAPTATSSSTGHGSASALALPPSITSMKSILSEEVAPRQLVNIIGLVKDFSPPIETRGTGTSVQSFKICRAGVAKRSQACPGSSLILGQSIF